MNKLYLIGIGYKPLDEKAREIIFNSSVILTSNRLFDVFKRYEGFELVKDKIKLINDLDKTIDYIKFIIQNPQSKIIALLSSGDPMFFGIGRKAIKELGKDRVEIIPDLSTIQVAFSRIKETWDDALLISLHGKESPEKIRKYGLADIPELLHKNHKIAILTDITNNPSAIAREIIGSGAEVYVFERLGYPEERIIQGGAEEISKMKFATPNLVVVVR